MAKDVMHSRHSEVEVDIQLSISFVLMMISGSLSKDFFGKECDIDFFIVTETGQGMAHAWTAGDVSACVSFQFT